MKFNQRFRVRAVRLGLVLAASAGVLAGTAPAAGASVVPAGSVSPASREVFHTCKVIGHAGTVQAVHCADLFTESVPESGLIITAQNEVYCQRIAPPNVGSIIACSGIHEHVGYGEPGHTFALPQQICGTLFHHSACAAGRYHHSMEITFADLGPTSARACSVWAESTHDSVVLPTTGHPTVSAAVVATPHFTYHIAPGSSCIEIPQ